MTDNLYYVTRIFLEEKDRITAEKERITAEKDRVEEENVELKRRLAKLD